jgi:hypothetical protein
MPPIGRNTKVTRLDQLTDDQIQARWAALTPKFIRWFLISAAASAGIFAYNHFMKPDQKTTDIASAAFQITLVFTFCFTMLTIASLYFRSGAWRKDRTKKST